MELMVKEDIHRAGQEGTKQCEKWEVKARAWHQCQYAEGWVKTGEELGASQNSWSGGRAPAVKCPGNEGTGVGLGAWIMAVCDICETWTQKARISNGGLLQVRIRDINASH